MAQYPTHSNLSASDMSRAPRTFGTSVVLNGFVPRKPCVSLPAFFQAAFIPLPLETVREVSTSNRELCALTARRLDATRPSGQRTKHTSMPGTQLI